MDYVVVYQLFRRINIAIFKLTLVFSDNELAIVDSFTILYSLDDNLSPYVRSFYLQNYNFYSVSKIRNFK